ncbi:MAG: hypothetical protein KJ747_02230 [Actinobacteria bacterium]|nr:hypothetical protein [Actinomycetota bacterium]
MAITRREFVTRMGALAAAVGLSQAEVAKLAESLAFTGTGLGGTLGKPQVVWIHGAECTGCSTSLLGLFEDTAGIAIEGTTTTTAVAAGLANILPTTLGGNDFTYHALGYNVDEAEAGASALTIADVIVDVIDLVYHETVMGMGADLAAQWLKDFMTLNDKPFVLVVEGALQDQTHGGAWDDSSTEAKDVSWCSIGMSANGAVEHDMASVVVTLAKKTQCIAVVPIGQCATFGGYPGCVATLAADATGDDFTRGVSQTNAMGTFDYLVAHGAPDEANKVINVPGCPTNPWWFTLTLVAFLIDFQSIGNTLGDTGTLGILKKQTIGTLVNATLPNGDAVDSTRRLKAVYGTPIHGPYCSRYQDYVDGVFATKPGQAGCLQKIGCKGPAANSLCGMHGWNGQQPQNPDEWDYGVGSVNPTTGGTKQRGGHCTRAGHPCMACTEKGYPDSFVPFVVR